MNNDALLRRTGYLTFLLSGVCAISSGIIVSFLQDLHGLSFGVTGSLLSMMNIGNMYAVIKGILRAQGGPDIGGVRAPLYELQPEDLPAVEALAEEIDRLVKKYA